MYNEFARYEEAFAAWQLDGYQQTSPLTYRYIDFLTDPSDDQSPRSDSLWPHQWDAFLRVVFCYEVVGKSKIGSHGLLLNVATGGGKTAVMAVLVAWLRIAHDVQKFVILCPNLIVRDRLEEDFSRGKVFKTRNLLPEWSNARPEDFTLT